MSASLSDGGYGRRPLSDRGLEEHMKLVVRGATLFLALFVAACGGKGTLDDSSVRTMRVDERLYEIRVAPTGAAGEYRMLVVRATLVIDPDAEREYARNWVVARRVMTQTCQGKAYKVLEDRLTDKVNLYTRFQCES